MEIKNYWAISGESQDDLKYTDNTFKIMKEQCKFLAQNTEGKVFAVFDEIRIDGSIAVLAETMSNAFKGFSGKTLLGETIAESSTKNLIDANGMFFDKRYGFEVCTDKYRFRLFELQMTPIYPIEIIIDEGVCKNIENTLSRIATPMDKFNHFKISDEETFCNVLQAVLQDKKVRYIIGELQKCAQDKKEYADNLSDKVIICEGQTDEIILQAISRKLNQKVATVVANGKNNVSAIFEAVKGKNTNANVLIVVDSDGDEKETKKIIIDKIKADNYELAIIDNRIEDWFMPEVADFTKLKLMQSIDTIIEEVDFEELSKANKSFAKVVEFLQNEI